MSRTQKVVADIARYFDAGEPDGEAANARRMPSQVERDIMAWLAGGEEV